MDITYETIIKYLVKQNTVIDNKIKFFNKKHLITYSDTFDQLFCEILQSKFYRYGVTQNIKNENVSFYMSFLTLLENNFITFSETEEVNTMENFKLVISNKIQNFEFSEEVNNYITKNKIQKKEIINTPNILLQCICEIHDCNFIMLNFKPSSESKFKCVYPGSSLNPWKPTFLFAMWDDGFEPIIYDVNSKRIFTYNDQQIKKLYSTAKIEYFYGEIIDKEYQLRDNLNEIITEIVVEPDSESEESVEIIVEDEDEDEDEDEVKENVTFIKNEYTDKTLQKLTKVELLKIIGDKNIKNANMKMLKNQLIELILQN